MSPIASDQTKIREHSFMIACLLSDSVGGLGWMSFLLIPFLRKWPFVWRGFLRKMRSSRC